MTHRRLGMPAETSANKTVPAELYGTLARRTGRDKHNVGFQLLLGTALSRFHSELDDVALLLGGHHLSAQLELEALLL
jgi:hypothetical protein